MRLAPYGGQTDAGGGNFIYKSKFNNNKYSILLQEEKEFQIFDETTNQVISKGTFTNGCLSLTVTSGKYTGNKFKDESAWDNVRKLVI